MFLPKTIFFLGRPNFKVTESGEIIYFSRSGQANNWPFPTVESAEGPKILYF